MTGPHKKLKITAPALIVVLAAALATTVVMRQKHDTVNPNLSPTNIAAENAAESNMEKNKVSKLYASINGKKIEIDLADNSTTAALLELQPMTLQMSDLNGNEKYAYLDKSLPTNSYAPRYIEAGDVMLFGNNCLVIFYESFETGYVYSKIGHIDDLPALGDGDISVSFTAE